MSRNHYHVGHNMPGYLPDGDPYVMSTKAGAIAASSRDAREHMESLWDMPVEKGVPGPRKSGNGGHYLVEEEPGNRYGTRETIYWINGPCGCEEGQAELADRYC